MARRIVPFVGAGDTMRLVNHVRIVVELVISHVPTVAAAVGWNSRMAVRPKSEGRLFYPVTVILQIKIIFLVT